MSTQRQNKLHSTALHRLRALGVPARLYLLHAALLTGSLAIYSVFFNLAIPALNYDLFFLGTLNTVSVAVAAVLSLPLWWMVTRIGLQTALIVSAVLQAVGVGLTAIWPTAGVLLGAVALTGAAATIFQVSAPPFMMEHSDAATRDFLFSANAAVNIGFAGIVTFFAGDLKAWLGTWLGVGAESALAYRATFAAASIGLILSLLPLFMIKRQSRPVTRESGTAQDPEIRAAAPLAPISPPVESPTAPHDRTLAASANDRGSWLDYMPFAPQFVDRLPPTVADLIRRPMRVLPLLISPLLISFGAAALILYLNSFFKARFGVSDIAIGRILAILGIATGLASLAGPIISTRIGKARTIVLTQLLSIPFLLVLGFVPILGIAVGAALVRGALFNMGSPLYDAFAMERTDEAARPIVIGLINGAYTVGYLVSPKISTWVQEQYGFGPLFIATTIFYGAAALTNYWLFVRKRSVTQTQYVEQPFRDPAS